VPIYRALAAGASKLLSWLLMASVAILIVPVSLQIFSRYTALIPSYIWTEEMARFLLVWMVMLGAMLAVRERGHFEVDVWPVLSARGAALLDLVSGVAVLVFAFTFLWWGFEFTRFAWKRFSELAELPLWMIHVAWPVTGAMWVLFQGERMAEAVRVLLGRGTEDDGAVA
jgi:TRAP-type C4-dicarboxylate transport system permease small subunit